MCYFNCVKRKKCEKIIEKTWFIIDTFVYVSISNINIKKVEDVNIIEKNFDSIIVRPIYIVVNQSLRIKGQY